ncbi:hypothetical protein FHS88_001042 [Roseomonas alkaliterrae]|uniref:Glycosyltransferase 61 catalytic domain-containing protein n=1 Tax=Neoroseomonas alkaliterrae TaxID=1452450 RepID=A0A840XLY4_9PROT|nr:glycosyltransferase family 61 protein [Neoroseomonas alkaliterrae]MBB5688926.1 hypothetical protein [Neoroseomonas alkaliterrae]
MGGAGDDGPPQDPHPSQALSGAAAPPPRARPEAPAIAAPPARSAGEGRPWPLLAPAFKDCLERADHAGLCALVLAARPATMPNWAIGQFLRAALAARDEQALRRAVEMAVAAPLQPALRARLALALVRHRQAGLALELLGDMLDAAPEPAARPALLTALAAVTLDGTAPADLRRWAAERRRALSGVVEGGFALAAIRPRRQAPSPSLAPLLGIAAAPGAGPGTAAALLETLERRAAWDSAEEPAARVRIYRDVFANRLGAIWRPDGTVLREPLPTARPLPAVAPGDVPQHDRAILATGNTNNLYHWFGGIFRGLGWRFEAGAEALPIALRDDALPAQAQSLRLLGGEAAPLIALGDCAHFGELHVPDWGGLGMHRGGAARFLFDRLVAAAGPAPEGRRDRRILISRRDANARRPEGEDALEAMFARHGFESVTLKGMPLADRIRMMQGAALVAGIHGAGLTMLFAARAGARVYEVMPWMPASLSTRCCMAAISGAFGLAHRVWIEPCDEARQAWEPHLAEMEEDLVAFLDGRPGPRSLEPGEGG